MAVTLELDGLKPTTDLPTRAVTSYVYTVDGTGTQTITLVTTGSTTTSKTCTVQLKADYFEDSETLSVVQSNTVTYSGTITVNEAKTFSDLQTNSSFNSTATYSITVADKNVNVTNGTLTYKTTTKQSGNWWSPSYYITGISSFEIKDVSISGAGIDTNTYVTIKITITANNNSRTVEYYSTIRDLGLK